MYFIILDALCFSPLPGTLFIYRTGYSYGFTGNSEHASIVVLVLLPHGNILQSKQSENADSIHHAAKPGAIWGQEKQDLRRRDVKNPGSQQGVLYSRSLVFFYRNFP